MIETQLSSSRERLFEFGSPIPRSDPGTWQWVDFPRTAAASGKPTGLAINFAPGPDARTLVIYFEPGGAAWNYLTASLQIAGYGTVLHLDEFTEHQWRFSPTSVLGRRIWLFDRDDETNPFGGAHFVYVPYCTGDVYVGDAIRILRGPLPGMQKTMHFRGQRNMREYLQRLVPTFSDLEQVYLVGSSAGGYGATFSWWLANVAWPTLPVDVISDSGHPLFFPRGQFDRWIRTWGPMLPRDGRECRQGLREVLEYAERHFLGQRRYALIAARKDLIMSLFFGMSPRTHAEQIDRLREGFFDDQERYPGTAHARYFIMDSHVHTVFPLNRVRRVQIGEMPLRLWLRQMVERDPRWSSWHDCDGVVTSSHPQDSPIRALAQA